MMMHQGQMQGHLALPHDDMKYMKHSNSADHVDGMPPAYATSTTPFSDDVIKHEAHADRMQPDMQVKQETGNDVTPGHSPGAAGLRSSHSRSSLTSPDAKQSSSSTSPSKSSFTLPADDSPPALHTLPAQLNPSHVTGSEHLAPPISSGQSPFAPSPWQQYDQQRHRAEHTDIDLHSTQNIHSMTSSAMPYAAGITSQDYMMSYYQQPHHAHHPSYLSAASAASGGSHSNSGYYSSWPHYNSQYTGPPQNVFNGQQYVT